MIRLATAVAVTLALLGAAYGLGRVQGRAALQARLDAAQVKADATDKADMRDLALAEQAIRRTATHTEDAIHAAPDLSGVCLPRGWLRANASGF